MKNMTLREKIISTIYNNGNRQITGDVLQGVLLDMVDYDDDNSAKIIETLEFYQTKEDSSLQTGDKTVVGAINELLSSGNVSGEVIAQALAELYAKVMGLGSVVDNMGYLRARRLTLDNFPEICGTPMYSSGEGAPSVPPEVPFQEYYDITNKKFYKAQGELPDTPTTANWIAIN